MSKGEGHPALWRTAATVVGSSWMEAVFITTKRHSSSVARVGSEGSLSRPAARMPMGVAALPRPSRFAVTLPLSCFASSGSCRNEGNRRPRMGRSPFASTVVSPTRSISFPSPAHRARGPAMDMHSCTAWTASPVKAAAASAPLSVMAANAAPMSILPIQNQLRNIGIPPVHWHYMPEDGGYSCSK